MDEHRNVVSPLADPHLQAANPEIEAYVTELMEQHNQEAVFARIAARFNTATDIPSVIETLREELHGLGYQYLSIWSQHANRLYWDQSTIELPNWLVQSLPGVAARYLRDRPLSIWVSLDDENIYSNCYHIQKPQSTQDDREIIESLHIGNIAFANLPAWLRKAGVKMMLRLNVRDHNAFPLGDYGILFLSNPSTNDSEKHKAWIQIILQQAKIAITRIQAVEDLKASQVRYQALFDRTNDAIFIIGLDMIHLAVNQQAANMLGYTVDELVGMHAQHVVAPEDWVDTQGRKEMLDRGEIPPIYRRTFIAKNGQRILTEVSVAMVYDNQGNPSHYQSIARNITERVRIQQQLNLQSTALQAAANGIVITSRDGVIQWANQAMADLSGYPLDLLMGNTPSIFNSGQQSAAFYTNLWTMITSGKVWQGEIINKRRDGTLYPEEMTITPVLDSDHQITHFIAIKQDISQRVKAQEMLEHLATHDPLTDLPNRALFNQHLKRALAQAKRNQQLLAVLFVDLDDFKPVNDTYGHEAGDMVLQDTAQRLLRCIRECDTAARLGGDEFAVLIEDIQEISNARIVADKIIQLISTPIQFCEHQISVSASIGISIYPTDAQDAETLLNTADQAMYAAKLAGKNRLRFYSADELR